MWTYQTRAHQNRWSYQFRQGCRSLELGWECKRAFRKTEDLDDLPSIFRFWPCFEWGGDGTISGDQIPFAARSRVMTTYLPVVNPGDGNENGPGIHTRLWLYVWPVIWTDRPPLLQGLPVLVVPLRVS